MAARGNQQRVNRAGRGSGPGTAAAAECGTRLGDWAAWGGCEDRSGWAEPSSGGQYMKDARHWEHRSDWAHWSGWYEDVKSPSSCFFDTDWVAEVAPKQTDRGQPLLLHFLRWPTLCPWPLRLLPLWRTGRRCSQTAS